MGKIKKGNYIFISWIGDHGITFMFSKIIASSLNGTWITGNR